ncbi:MAG: DUF3343 domain-containing protein [Bacillota bacterium]|nr:DUF3343 domain-containing protein [Bacillota bacterium]
MYYLIMCRSLTHAQRVANGLERAGIPARILRTPAAIAPSGCSHSVRIPGQSLSRTLTTLNRLRLPHLGIYVGGAEGYREVEA